MHLDTTRLGRLPAWSGAVIVTVITLALVGLDLTDGSVHRYWSRHSFTSSVLSGVLVLLLTVLIIDRVTRMRQLKNQSRAMGAQAAVILAQAVRTADAITKPSPADEDRDEASDELRTYTQMLLTSAPLLIDASVPRTFLETAQRVAAQLYRALRQSQNGTTQDVESQLNHEIARLRQTAAPLLAGLNREQRAAVSSDEAPPS